MLWKFKVKFYSNMLWKYDEKKVVTNRLKTSLKVKKFFSAFKTEKLKDTQKRFNIKIKAIRFVLIIFKSFIYQYFDKQVTTQKSVIRKKLKNINKTLKNGKRWKFHSLGLISLKKFQCFISFILKKKLKKLKKNEFHSFSEFPNYTEKFQSFISLILKNPKKFL